MSVGKRIQAIREKQGLSQNKLAMLSKVSQSALSDLEAEVNSPRYDTLVLIAKALDVSISELAGEPAASLPAIDNILGIETQKIPLLGEIAAGNPIYADEDFECYVELGAKIQADFALRVKGDSMVNARIMDGDIVFIRKQQTVNNGEIAAVLIGDDATLKRFYRDGDTVTLLAENSAHPPWVIQLDESTDVRILGKAIAFQSDIR